MIPQESQPFTNLDLPPGVRTDCVPIKDDIQACEDVAGEHEGAIADERLVKRCIQGDVAAWEALYAQCHGPLCTLIRLGLRRSSADANLVDEFAARVWYALVSKDGDLLVRYDPRRGGRIITYLWALARDEIRRHFRSEHRRSRRERIASGERRDQASLDFDLVMPASLNDFFKTLTPAESGFWNDYLFRAAVDEQTARGRTYSPSYIEKLTQRIHKKLLNFLGQRTQDSVAWQRTRLVED